MAVITPEVVLAKPGGFFFQLVASPGGALFVSSEEGVARALDPNGPWQPIGDLPDVVTGLYAPSNDVVFAIARGCATVHRWDEASGWREMNTPVRDSVWNDGHFPTCLRALDIWGRSEDDVYVVGSSGTILHYDGTGWALEPNPLVLPPGSPKPARDSTTLWSVTGNLHETYAGGVVLLRKTATSGWDRISSANSALPSGCGFSASAVERGTAFFGANQCLVEVKRDRLTVLRNPITQLVTPIFRGSSQRDGTALFWSYEGEVVDISHGEPLVYRLRDIGAIGGMVALDGYLYAAGRNAAGGLIVRVVRPQ